MAMHAARNEPRSAARFAVYARLLRSSARGGEKKKKQTEKQKVRSALSQSRNRGPVCVLLAADAPTSLTPDALS